MNCARCDSRGTFNVYSMRPGAKRPHLIEIPCPNCTRSEADELLIGVLRKRIGDLERKIVEALTELQATDMRSGFSHEEERPTRRYAGVDRVVEILSPRPLDVSDAARENRSHARPDEVPVVPAQPTPSAR